ncbi:MAG: aldo/keto reductase [Planctomycetota bacterium]|jgi:predicted aldo/keto reductase-like oxidoreductase
MLYNTFGTSGVKVSAISIGAMRWPSEQQCCQIIRHGLDLGVNYIDTSTGYVQGRSLGWSGAAVKDRRDEILFSCKSFFGKAPSADEVREAIETSLAKAGLEYFDLWQLWGLGTMEVIDKALAPGGTVEGVRKAQDEGLVKAGMGFTFHGPGEVFRKAIDSGEFLCATVSYNLLNRKEEENIAYAGSKGVGIVIMNPLAGGVLGLAGPRTLDFLCGDGIGPSFGALRFLLANPGITTPIVGFTAVDEVDQAVAALAGAEQLDEAFRRDLMDKADNLQLIEGDFCTGCGYCKECPQGFTPSKFMQAMRDFVVYGVAEDRLKHWLLSRYPHTVLDEHLAKCTECGTCEEQCPQKLPIIEQIAQAKKLFGIE